jgi:NTP pyrophosphatase (non-canonical NTP hydrolase)
MDSMTAYQSAVIRTAALNEEPRLGIAILAMGLAGETGELVDILKKVIGHGHEFDRARVRDEAGDVLWYLTALLDEFDLTLAEVALFNIRKLQARYPDGFDQERSRNRGELRVTCASCLQPVKEVDEETGLCSPCFLRTYGTPAAES